MYSFLVKVDITNPPYYIVFHRNIRKSLWRYYHAKMTMPHRLLQYTAVDPPFSRYMISLVKPNVSAFLCLPTTQLHKQIKFFTKVRTLVRTYYRVKVFISISTRKGIEGVHNNYQKRLPIL
jgi:hypothetical protein